MTIQYFSLLVVRYDIFVKRAKNLGPNVILISLGAKGRLAVELVPEEVGQDLVEI